MLFIHLYFQVSVSVFVYEKNCRAFFYLDLIFDCSSCFDFRINRKQSMPGFCLQWLVAWKLLLFFFSCSLKQYLICA